MPMNAKHVPHNKGWSEDMEAAFKKTIKECRQHAWIHYQSETFYIRAYLMMAIPSTLLNVIVGSVGLVTLSEMVHDPLWYVLLVLFSLNIMLGFLNGVNSLLEPNSTARNHRESATDFIKLARWLQLQLDLDIEYRDHCESVSKVSTVQYENLMANSSHVPSWIVNKLVDIIDTDSPLPEQVIMRDDTDSPRDYTGSRFSAHITSVNPV